MNPNCVFGNIESELKIIYNKTSRSKFMLVIFRLEKILERDSTDHLRN